MQKKAFYLALHIMHMKFLVSLLQFFYEFLKKSEIPYSEKLETESCMSLLFAPSHAYCRPKDIKI